MQRMYSQSPFPFFVQDAEVSFVGQPATKDCLAADFATIWGFL